MPKIVNHEERRKLIAEAAAEEIAENGIAGVRLTEVAKRAGWTTGVVTHYFSSKEELLGTALQHTLQTLIDAAILSAESSDGPVLDNIYDWLPTSDERVKAWKIWLSYGSTEEFSETYKIAHSSFYNQVTKAIKTGLQTAIDKGEVREDINIAVETDNLIAFLDGVGVRVALGSSDMTTKRQRKMLECYLERLK